MLLIALLVLFLIAWVGVALVAHVVLGHLFLVAILVVLYLLFRSRSGSRV